VVFAVNDIVMLGAWDASWLVLTLGVAYTAALSLGLYFLVRWCVGLVGRVIGSRST
jgi:hypothetical protein